MNKLITPETMESKPTLLLSRCLNLELCRYDGKLLEATPWQRIQDCFQTVLVCPEVQSGMPTPRPPIDLVSADANTNEIMVLQRDSGTNHTKQLHNFCRQFLRELDFSQIHGAILKSRSPSCASVDAKLYDWDSKSLISTQESGLFTRALQIACPDLPVIDEKRISNRECFEKFLNKVYFRLDSRQKPPQKLLNCLNIQK